MSKPKIKKQIIKNDDWGTMLESPAARRIIWEILEHARTFGSSFDENPHRMSYNEGQRAVGQYIYTEIMRNCPERFLQAQNEMNSALKQIELKNKENQQGENGEEDAGE